MPETTDPTSKVYSLIDLADLTEPPGERTATVPRPRAPQPAAPAAPAARTAPAPARKATPAKKAAPAKKATPAARPAPARKAAPAKKTAAPQPAPAKKAAPAPARKAVPAKKAAAPTVLTKPTTAPAPTTPAGPVPATVPAPAKKAVPAKKAAPAKKKTAKKKKRASHLAGRLARRSQRAAAWARKHPWMAGFGVLVFFSIVGWRYVLRPLGRTAAKVTKKGGKAAARRVREQRELARLQHPHAQHKLSCQCRGNGVIEQRDAAGQYMGSISCPG